MNHLHAYSELKQHIIQIVEFFAAVIFSNTVVNISQKCRVFFVNNLIHEEQMVDSVASELE